MRAVSRLSAPRGTQCAGCAAVILKASTWRAFSYVAVVVVRWGAAASAAVCGTSVE